MRSKLIVLLLLVAGLAACGPAYVKKYYITNSTTQEGTEPAPITTVSITLYNQQGQPVIVQPAPSNISIIVSTTVLYTADGKPVTVTVVNSPANGGTDKGSGDDK